MFVCVLFLCANKINESLSTAEDGLGRLRVQYGFRSLFPESVSQLIDCKSILLPAYSNSKLKEDWE